MSLQAGQANTSGTPNVFPGFRAGYSNTTGGFNTLIGTTSTTGSLNVLVGFNSQLTANLTNAVAIGANARVSVSNAIVLANPDNTSLAVGIGTDAPQYPLDGRGTINLRNKGTLKFSHLRNSRPRQGATDQFLTVNEQGESVLATYCLQIDKASLWADKVFARGYDLKRLADVSSFINQHGYLPGIPTAEQVVKEGIDPAKMDAKLLEKIEELTLYSIQLEKADQQKQQKIQPLEQKQAQVERLLHQLLKQK